MTWLTNQFLIAMPFLTDSLFEKTVVLVCQHDEDGALGIVVNKTTGLFLEDILTELNLQYESVPSLRSPVFYGGPVQMQRGLILHDSKRSWAATIPIGNHLGLTMSKDVLEDISVNRGPELCLPVLGFSGWGSQQLEQEMRDNYWLSTPVDNSIIFDTPINERWQKAASIVGIDITSMSGFTGNA